MTLSDCFQLGVITKAHGLHGEVQILIDSDEPENYKKLESVLLLINNELVPFFLKNWQLNGTKAIARFEEVDSLEKASKLPHTEVYLPDSLLPKLDDDQYYYHDLVGLHAFEEDKELGIVSNVYNLPGHDLLAVMVNDKEVLVPISDEVIRKVDISGQKILLQLPHGLLDIYLEP